MDTKKIKKIISKHFSPKIWEIGWEGAEFHYRKNENNHVVNILGFQSSRSEDALYCETAIAFDFIKDMAGLTSEKSTYESCLIRERLHPLESSRSPWPLYNDQEKNIQTMDSIWKAFLTEGSIFYNDFADFPHPFDKIQPSDIEKDKYYKILGKYATDNNIELANLLTKINLLLGRNSLAKEFSEIGIAGVQKLGKKLLIGRKSKSYRELERHLEAKIKELTIV